MRTGEILQVVGPVVDVVFPLEEGVPDIHNALHVMKEDGEGHKKTITLETAVELGMVLYVQLPWNQLMVFNEV